MKQPTPITDALALLERSASSGNRAHLSAELVRALIEHPAYGMLVETRTQELIAGFPEVPPRSRRSTSFEGGNEGEDDGTAAFERARAATAVVKGRRPKRP